MWILTTPIFCKVNFFLFSTVHSRYINIGLSYHPLFKTHLSSLINKTTFNVEERFHIILCKNQNPVVCEHAKIFG